MNSLARWFVVFMLLSARSASAAEYRGIVEDIVDGDTFFLCRAGSCEEIRLCGINAPDEGKFGDEMATDALRSLVQGKEVVCTQVGDGSICDGRAEPTSRERIVAQCFLGGQDIAATMIREGYACDRVSQTGGSYSNDGVGMACLPKP